MDGHLNDLKEHAEVIGSLMAEKFMTTTPPPWNEEWFGFAYGQMIAAACDTFKTTWPHMTADHAALAQEWFCTGFEARVAALLPAMTLVTSEVRN